VRNHEFLEKVIGTPPLLNLEDFSELGREAARRGYKAVKTNPIVFDGVRPRMLNPGFGPVGLDLAHNYDQQMVDAITDQLAALREGLGPQFHTLTDTPTALILRQGLLNGRNPYLQDNR
jgi:hypothetical protein